jgi:hypothetical protein
VCEEEKRNAVVNADRKCCHRARTPSNHLRLILFVSINLANTARDGRASRSPAGAVDGTGTKTTLGEARPDFAGVGATSEGAVGIEDSVAGLDEVGVAWLAEVERAVSLYPCNDGIPFYPFIFFFGVGGRREGRFSGLDLQSHSLHDNLHRQEPSIGRYAVPECRLDCCGFPKLVDQIPHNWGLSVRSMDQETFKLPS